MKRGRSLVDYGSSDEDQEIPVPQKKQSTSPSNGNTASVRRKLPQLSAEFLGDTPVDNPLLHQGRRRSTPHVEGQFAAYVYIPVIVEQKSKLWRSLREVVDRTKAVVPALRSDHFQIDISRFCEDNNGDNLKKEKKDTFELHISLTRPIFLRHYQREELRRAVKAAARSQDRFTASFSAFISLNNDERSRTFLGIEIGAGHEQLSKMTSSLNETLRLLHQKEFYTEPRYHASFAWALLNPPSPQSSEIKVNETDFEFLSIPNFPADLIPELNRDFATILATHGIFEVEHIKLKIGKDVSAWSLKT